MTTTEYFQTDETTLPRELAGGMLRVADAPSLSHQRMVGELFLSLQPFVREHRLGHVYLAPVDVILDFDQAIVVQPDLVFVSNDRSPIAAERIYGAPDVVIEVLSPHTRIGRLDEHIAWFSTYGVRECWLVSLAERQVAVLGLDVQGVARRTVHGPGQPLASEVLPGFRTPVLYAW